MQNTLKVVLTVLMMAYLPLTSIYANDDKVQLTAEEKEFALVKAQLEKSPLSLGRTLQTTNSLIHADLFVVQHQMCLQRRLLERQNHWY